MPMLAPLAIGASLAGGALGAFGAISQGDYQAQVAKNNAQIARVGQATSLEAGAANEQQVALRNRATLGAVKAGQASNGLDVNRGSAKAVQFGVEDLGTLSTATVRNNAARAAFGLGIQADSDSAQAAADIQGSEFAAAGSLLGGIGQAGGLANQFRLSGALPGSGAPTMGS
jgi:hypothetical protein